MKPPLRAAVAGLALAALVLTGCLPSAGIARLEAAEAVAEREIDALLDFAVDRLCEIKMDAMARAAARNPDMARAMFYACPEVKAFMLSLLQAVGTAGFNVDVQISDE